jgi:rfaE bifunctional protein kinase chain/domain
MLTTATLEHILRRLPGLHLAVVGDLFLDRYLEIDAALTEPSLETGLDAYQVTRVRSLPGAAGTVINNLSALGVGKVSVVAVIGDDGEGYELRQALRRLPCVDDSRVLGREDRRTPTYTKPLLCSTNSAPRELNRLDIKNRTLLPVGAEDRILEALKNLWPTVDALVVVDQVSEAECGVITSRVREHLAKSGTAHPDKLILADSRERIGLFGAVALKPNLCECRRAFPQAGEDDRAILALVEATGRPVFCTHGEKGILLKDPRLGTGPPLRVPAYPVTGEIDVVGAGDSTSAGIASAVAAGASLQEAAAFGNLVASITIQQLGTTGTASPAQVRQRWAELGNQND